MRTPSLGCALLLASAATAATLHKAEDVDTIMQKVSQQCSDMPDNCRLLLTALGDGFRGGVLKQSTQALDEAMLRFQKDTKAANCVSVVNDCAAKIKANGGE